MLTQKSISGVSALALCTAACVTPYAKPAATVAVGDAQTVEGQPARVPIIKTGNGNAKFSYSISPGTAGAADYVAQSGTITTGGNTAISVGTVDDADVEGPESFNVQISSANNNTTVSRSPGRVDIADNDTTPPPQPIQCEDGSTVIPPAECPVTPPPQPVQCWDGSTVVPPAVCPIEPPPGPVTCWDMTQVTPPAVCPVEPPKPPSGNIPGAGLGGAAPINSIDPNLATKPAGIPGTAAPDTVGAFRFVCGFAGVGKFDPKVYPGDMSGKSHGHQFYGNTGIYPYSGYPELRQTGFSTCSYGDYPANRNGYWQPWLEDGRGHILQPDNVVVYYKRTPQNDPGCAPGAASPGGCVAMPHGLFYIFGYDFLTQTVSTGTFDFTCQTGSGTIGVFKNLTEAAASPLCVAGAKLASRGTGPKCWDGVHVDSANHRSHVAGMVRNNATGKSSCDAAHPYIIPTLSIFVTWSIAAGDDLRLFHFSSDYMRPDLPPGSTYHTDIFQAWEPGVHDQFHAGCINKLLNCSSGNTGVGRMINSASVPFYPDPVTGKPVSSWTNPYRVIPIPGAEANTGLVGMNFGKAGPKGWARGVKPGTKIAPLPDWLEKLIRERFERDRLRDGVDEPGPLPAYGQRAPVVGHGERGQN